MALAPQLDIPSQAITDAQHDPEWVEVPLGPWLLRRRPRLRIPLDAHSATRTRWHFRFTPWLTPVVIAAWSWTIWPDLHGALWWAVHLAAAVVLVTAVCLGVRPFPQLPDKTSPDQIVLSEVPAEVAQLWAERNPGVSTTDAPAPWPRSRRFYAGLSAGLFATAACLGMWLTDNGRSDPSAARLIPPLLTITAIAVGNRLHPRGFITVERSKQS